MPTLQRRYPAVELRDTEVGLGVFTRQRFRRCQIVGDVCGTAFFDDSYDSAYCMELGPGRVLEPAGDFRYLNHSCDPNCELFFYQPLHANEEPPDRLWLKALRPIQVGEQLTIDYAWPAERAIPCHCGSPNCRGWIVSAEELPLIANMQGNVIGQQAGIANCESKNAN
jgi:hypothetical protein